MAGVQGSPLSHSMGTDTTLHVHCICREGREGGEGREGREGGKEGRWGGLENNNLLFANGIFVCALKFCLAFNFRVHVIFSMYMCRYI